MNQNVATESARAGQSPASAGSSISLGRAIAEARQACNMTQQDLCSRTGIAYSTLTKIERGAIKKPNVFTVLQIAQATNLQIEDLLQGATSMLPPNPYTASKAKYKAQNITGQTSRTGVKFVYFDVHQVLVNSIIRGILPAISALTGRSSTEVEKIYLLFHKDLCSGKASMKEFNYALSQGLGRPDIDWLDFYIRYAEANRDIQAVFEWISQNYQVGLLTNAFPGNVSALIQNKIIPAHYAAIVDSSVIGKTKPDKDIYEYAQKQAKVSAEEILLIDDRLINIVGAQACGWQGFWINDESRLDLRSRLQNLLNFD